MSFELFDVNKTEIEHHHSISPITRTHKWPTPST